MNVNFTIFQSPNALTKQYTIDDSGSIVKHPAATMTSGAAKCVSMPFAEFAKALSDVPANVAFGYGGARATLPRKLAITVSGKERPADGVVSRSKRFFEYQNCPGILMLDHDPSEYGQSFSPEELLNALATIHPELRNAARVVRGSVSAGVHRVGELPQPGRGFHIYIPVQNAADIPRYGRTLFDRLWLAGHGFVALAANGAALVRSPIDSAVFNPERLDFVGKPVISGESLTYTPQTPQYTEGNALDTMRLTDLSSGEALLVKQMQASAASAIKTQTLAKQADWMEARVNAMVLAGVNVDAARSTVKSTVEGGFKDLYDNFILEFTSGPVTVADVLAAPDIYDGKALADPVEGRDYGATTSKFYANNGTPVVNSMAHGGGKYFLRALPKFDSGFCVQSEAAPIEALIEFEWERPIEIESNVPPVDALTPELIPEPLRPWLADVSHRMQTPPDFAAVSAIVIAGSLIGAGCSIRPKRYDDWEVVPNVWGACIGRPSVVLKSPSMKEPMQLLERLQAEFGELFEQEKAGAEFDSLANKAMLDDVKGQLSKAAKGAGKDRAVNPDDMQKLKADYLELTQNAEHEATRRLFKTNESSIQSMTVLQTQNPRGILVFRDELTGLLVKWDREDGQDERAYFLEGWNGNGSYTDCKIGRGVTDAKQICISLLGGIQPDKLKRYLYQAQQGNNDGMMQRLQLAVWPDEPEHWQLIDTIPNKADKQRAYDIVKRLAELDFIQYGATQSEYDDRPYFRFDEAGQAVFNKWIIELQTVKIRREENPLMAEHFGKFRSLMPSLALIFHCIEIADGKARGNVSEKAARLAVEWCSYLESHARRIYAMAESPEHEAAVRLADKIKAKALPSPFTTRDVERKCWHGLKDKQEIESACNILIDENWLMMTRKPKPSTGRPPLPDYYINPIFL
ncbi:MAG: DUF3987 domain-containing protein [Methylococcaceae bacterium]|nr:DUF3987 domain-containing protein [Methylococcaceae bacterium]